MHLFLAAILAYFGAILLSIQIVSTLSVFKTGFGCWPRYSRLLQAFFKHASAISNPDCKEHVLHCKSAECTFAPVKHLSSRNLIDLENQSKTHSKFHAFDETLDFYRDGFRSIVHDDFTEAINPGELSEWNLLWRTHPRHATKHPQLLFLYVCGAIFRYCYLLPVRTLVMANAMTFLIVVSAILAQLPSGPLRAKLDRYMNLTFFRMLSSSFGLNVVYHNLENRPRGGSICVANHATPIDIPILASDNYYSLVGQRHVGWLGLIERRLEKVSQHIWFDRFERQDRSLTRQRLSDHAKTGKPPILIFPEGVCVNNTAVLKFRKGCFELGAAVYPVVLKYSRTYGEPLWHQSTWFRHHVDVMSTWALNVDVYYLPPMVRLDGEEAVDFASRVQSAVADCGGLIRVTWDGSLKYNKAPNEHMEQIHRANSENILKTLTNNNIVSRNSSL